jgi:tryptophan synthase beta chain
VAAQPPLPGARWEKALDTPAKIYYKWEGVSPAGSHKPNTAVAQCYYAKQEGLTGFATETGAGQWGSASALPPSSLAWSARSLWCRSATIRNPIGASMETWGGTVVPSPSTETNAGRAILAQDPETPGSLGMAISEAIEYAVTHEGYKYSLGSVVNFVLLHQTVIGLEAKKQMEMAGDYPDILIGCAGGGSNAAGLIFPFMQDKLNGSRPRSARHLCRVDRLPEHDARQVCLRLGRHGQDGAGGQDAHRGPRVRPGAGARRRAALSRHGAEHLRAAGPGEAEARAYHQNACFEAALSFARARGRSWPRRRPTPCGRPTMRRWPARSRASPR